MLTYQAPDANHVRRLGRKLLPCFFSMGISPKDEG